MSRLPFNASSSSAASSPIREQVTASSEETWALGRYLGRLLTRPVVLRLSGDLGSGKTCFVQGLARGLDVPLSYDITSPTYTLVHEYPGRWPFYHVDLYRLEGILDAASIGLEDILYEKAVVAVEWAEKLPIEAWPPNGLDIRFGILSDTRRQIRISAYGLAEGDLIKELFIA